MGLEPKIAAVYPPAPKQAARDMGVLWSCPQKGLAIGLREMNHQFGNEIMGENQRGAGILGAHSPCISRGVVLS